MNFSIYVISLIITFILLVMTINAYTIKSAVYSGRLFGVNIPQPKEVIPYKIKFFLLMPLTILAFTVAFFSFFASLFSGFFMPTIVILLIAGLLLKVLPKIAPVIFKKGTNKCLDIAYRNSYPVMKQGLADRQITQDIHSLIAYTENIYVCDEYIQFRRFDDTVVYLEYSSYQYEDLTTQQMALMAGYIYHSYRDDFDFNLNIITIPGERPKMSYGFVGGSFIVARQSGTPDTRILTGYNIFRKPGTVINTTVPPISMPTNNESVPVVDNGNKFCSKCGTQLASNVSFCSSCGLAQ